MSKAPHHIELDELIGAVLDGAKLSPQQKERLETLLVSDPGLLDQYVITAALENDLSHVASLAVSTDGESAHPRRATMSTTSGWPTRGFGVSLLALAASFAMVSLSLGLLWRGKSNSGLTVRARPDLVATVVSQEEWDESDTYPVGSRIPTGVFSLNKGVVQLQLDSGPNLLIEGPASLDIKGVSRAHLTLGKLVFRDDSGGDPFHLSTAWSELIDLGTEYAISVTDDDEEVHVFSGAVERTGIVQGERLPAQLLSDGQAMRYSHNASLSTKAFATEPEKFVREVDPGWSLEEQPKVTSEYFDYEDRSAMMENTADGGRGWASPWRRNVPDLPGHNADDLALRVGESLVFGSTSEASSGGSLGYVGHWFTHRELAEPINLAANQVVYLSFLYRPTGMWVQGENGFKLLFFNPGEGVIEHRIAIALDAGRGVIRGALCGARKQCPLPMSDGSTYLIVAKIACSTDNPDQLMLRVFQPDEPVRVHEPADWTVVAPTIESNDSFRLMSLLFNCEKEQRIDEIRIGDTWMSVVYPWLKDGVAPQLELSAMTGE